MTECHPARWQRTIELRTRTPTNGWTSPQMHRRYGASARSARARRSYDRIMDDSPWRATAPGQASHLARTTQDQGRDDSGSVTVGLLA